MKTYGLLFLALTTLISCEFFGDRVDKEKLPGRYVFQIDNSADQEFLNFFVQFDEHVDQNEAYSKFNCQVINNPRLRPILFSKTETIYR